MKNKNLSYDKVATYFKLNKKSFILATISGVLFNGFMAFIPILEGKMIDAVEEGKDASYIFKLSGLFLIFVIFVQFNRFLKRYYVRDFVNRMVLEMRTKSFENLITDDIRSFAKTSKGDIMNKELSDIKDSAEGVRKILTEVYDSIILMCGYLISLFIMNWKVTLIVLVFLILSILFANFMKKLIYKTTSDYKKTFSHNKDVTLNSLKNEIYYRGYGVLDKYFKEYSSLQDTLEKKSIKSMIFKGSLEPSYQAIAVIGIFFVIYFLGKKVMDGTMLIGTLTAYLTTFTLVSTKAAKVGKVFNAATTFKVSWARCKEYLVTREEMETLDLKNTPSNLIVDNLTFGFDDKFSVKNISFNAQRGESIGICGLIHTGKSTLGGALSGIYDYKGSIKLCGYELSEIRNDNIENFIGYAPSNVELFNDSINYNISFNKGNISDILDLTYLTEDVSSFINGENEIISHSTSNLSGGQAKRVELARAIYNKPKLIILDDPFNAIDLKMSLDITDNIKNYASDSIIVIINNQKEILEKMDKILFLKGDTYLFDSFENLMKDSTFKDLLGENI